MALRNHRIGSLTVPALSLGTMHVGTRVAAAKAHQCLDEADELGVRFWDTANNDALWAGGEGSESETVIGDWFVRRGSAAETVSRSPRRSGPGRCPRVRQPPGR